MVGRLGRNAKIIYSRYIHPALGTPPPIFDFMIEEQIHWKDVASSANHAVRSSEQ